MKKYCAIKFDICFAKKILNQLDVYAFEYSP